jgi:dTDP-L-rhamnose 4-epimerase
MSQRILVTGGAGFIGSRTVLRLLELGHQVVVLDSLSPQVHGDDPTTSYTLGLIRGKCEFVRGSVNDMQTVSQLVSRCDAVLHLAAETGTGQSMYQVSDYVHTNVVGTAVLAEAILSSGSSVERVVLASSRSIYGEGAYRCAQHGTVYPGSRRPEDTSRGAFEVMCPTCGTELTAIPTAEEAKACPLSVYAATKLQQEHLLQTALARRSGSLTVLRYQNVFGPGQSLRNPYTGIISIFSVAALAHKKVSIFEDGLESRDFVYIDDVAEANTLALTQPLPKYAEINVGTGIPTSVMDVYRGIVRSLGAPEICEVTGEYRVGDIRHCFASIDKLRQVMGLTPRVSFSEGLSRVAVWASERAVLEGDDGSRYQQSLNELRERALLTRRRETRSEDPDSRFRELQFSSAASAPHGA